MADYFHQTDQEEAVIDGLTAPCRCTTSSLLRRVEQFDVADSGLQPALPYVPGSVAIDVRNDFFDALPIGNSDPSAVARFNLLGYTDSARNRLFGKN